MEALISFVFTFALPAIALLVFFAVGRAREQRHLRELDAREAEMRKSVYCTNLRTVPAAWRVSNATFVDGGVVIASDAFKTWASGIRAFFGGEMKSFQTMLTRARREAVLRMLEEARRQGANVVWNVRLETASIGRGNSSQGIPCAELHAYGTALRVENTR